MCWESQSQVSSDAASDNESATNSLAKERSVRAVALEATARLGPGDCILCDGVQGESVGDVAVADEYYAFVDVQTACAETQAQKEPCCTVDSSSQTGITFPDHGLIGDTSAQTELSAAREPVEQVTAGL